MSAVVSTVYIQREISTHVHISPTFQTYKTITTVYFAACCYERSEATTDGKKKIERLLSEADGTLGLHIKLQQLLNLCYIKAFPLAVDSI